MRSRGGGRQHVGYGHIGDRRIGSGEACGGPGYGGPAGISEDTFRNPTLESFLSKEVFRSDFRGSRAPGRAALDGCPSRAAVRRWRYAHHRRRADHAVHRDGQPAAPDHAGDAGDPRPAGPVLVRVEGRGSPRRSRCSIDGLPPGAERTAEVPVTVAAPHGPGSRLSVTVIAEAAGTRAEQAGEITVAEPGWTIWMVCHFHYDPVWWNTQGGFTQTGLAMPGEDGKLPDVRTAFELVRLHLDAARDDPDYKFVLAEVDYLKPYFDAHPEDRAELRELIAAGRVGARRRRLQRAQHQPDLGRVHDPQHRLRARAPAGRARRGPVAVAWALDAFGHDPGYPGLMAAAGHDRVGLGARAVPPVGAVAHGRRQRPDAVPQRVRVDLPRRPRAADQLHGQPLRRGLGASTRPPTWPRRRRRRSAQLATARPGGGHPERAAAGRRRPRHPGPVGDRAAPGLRRPLRLAAVRHRAAAGVLRGGARRGRRARDLADPADQGHEPGVPGQGRVLHRHQAGPAGRRGGGVRRRAAGHAGLAGRRRTTRRSRWTRRGGNWCSARTTTRSPAPSPTRCTWTCSAGGGRRSSGARRRARRRRASWPAW